MKSLILKLLILLIFTFSYSNILIKRDYSFKNDGVYLNDLYPTNNNLKLFNVPKNMQTHRVGAIEFINTLKEHNIVARNLNKISHITFTRKINFDDSGIKSLLMDKFLSKYRDIEINNLEIKSMNYANFLNDMSLDDISISTHTLNKSKGSFKAIFISNDNKQIKKSIFYSFNLDASIKAIEVTEDIMKGSSINDSNSKEVLVNFKLANRYIKSLPKYSVSSRALRANHILGKYDIKKEWMVKKGARIQIELNLDSIEVIDYFKVLENGYMDSYVKVQNIKSDKIREAKVVGKSKLIIE